MLDDAGIKHVKIVGPIDDTKVNMQYAHENVSKKQQRDYVKEMALLKIKPFIGKVENGAVIAADTTVFCKGRILEKPLTKERCKEQHEFFSGKTTINYTGYAVYYNGKTLCRVMATKVRVARLPKAVIQEICNEPEILDCAGYRNQGNIGPYLRLKESQRGNLTGLHIPFVLKMLKSVGWQGTGHLTAD
jgi:septum formation protein